MANPVYQSYTTTGAMPAVSLDNYQTPFNASVFVYVASGAATYSVQFTPDPIDKANVTPRWYTDANIPVGSSTNLTSSYNFPVRAVRINIATNSGTVEFKVLQGM